MSTSTEPRVRADVRDYLAEERTFLGWIRTGLAVMAFGFVVARFGLFLEEIRIAQGDPSTQSHHVSVWFGTAVIAAGVAVNLLSALRHTRVVEALSRAQYANGPSKLAVTLAFFVALVGIAMAIYASVA